MVTSAKQRQKNIEKKKKKKNLRKKASSPAMRLGGKASSYSEYPIHECLVHDGLFESGIGSVIVARRVSEGLIATGAFVVDVYCLGVKNALFSVISEDNYEHGIKSRLMMSDDDQQLDRVHPACARKLIEGAVSYASGLGFSAHRDYSAAKGIFGDIRGNACPVKYTYGVDGKPFYMRGPMESMVQANKIVTQLERVCGAGNFEYYIEFGEEDVG